ncbi:M23 family metallopeptidase [Streptomyces sp. AJS327]|nr:M23 family metallopeptidase [Streptomyces sp. AJS327]
MADPEIPPRHPHDPPLDPVGPPRPAGTPDRTSVTDLARASTGLSWSRPLRSPARISQSYGVRGGWASGYHTGVDLAVPVGTPVRSVGAGRVVFAGRSGAYGKAVTIRMRDGKYTLFAHLSRIHVRKGQRVRAGTLIGKSGNTGQSSGPHLHFEVRAARGYGSDIDPRKYLAQRGVRL